MTPPTAPPGGDPDIDADVVIVGGGPVGLTLAILLAQHDHSVIVVERWARPYPLPRAVHFDHEVGRVLQSCGIGDELRGITEPAEIYEWRNAEGAILLRFGRIGAGLSGWPESSMFCQPELEALLERRAGELQPIEIRRGIEVSTVDQHGDQVVVGDADGGRASARYAVGCDGANSTLRDLIGVVPHDLGFFYDWLIVDVVLDEPRVFDPLNLQICDPDRPTTVVSGGPGRRRWEFMRLPHESLDELNDEARAWDLLAEWDVNPGNARLERHAVYTFQARYAEQWRVERVLLAGDAAHQMPPFAGQGLCAGIRDAANLAWKLDLVLDHRVPDTLLDRYPQERLPSARQAIEFSMELGKIICVPDAAEAAARDQAMAAAVTADLAEVPELPGIAEGIVHPSAPNAGRLFVQGAVGGALFDDAYGAGWRLVTVADDTDALEPALRQWFESIGGRVIALTEPDPAYGRWFADHDAAWALQRPDFHLFATATSPDEANDLLTTLHHQLDAGQPGAAPATLGVPT